MRALILIISIFSFMSCSKEEPIIEMEFYNGTASAKINGDNFEWSPRMEPSHGNDSTYSLQIHYLLANNVLRKKITFLYLVDSELIQNLKKSDLNNNYDLQCQYTTRIEDGDVIGNFYLLNAEDDIHDYIQLTSFDESTGMVTGQFQASFVVDPLTRFDPSSPDTIVITDGYFETTLFD